MEFVVLVGEFSHGEDFAQHNVVLTPLLLSPLRSSLHGPDRMSRVSSQYMLLIAEFVVDLLCTGRMSETEYREFLIVALESLSGKFDEKLGRNAPQGLARATAEEMTGELCAMVERLRADRREVRTLH